jgi:dihydrofolate reductase
VGGIDDASTPKADASERDDGRARARLTLIAAVARDGAIGRANTLPWRLPEDLRHFKAATMGRPLIMGRKTFDSIGRPLPGRRSIVISRREDWHATGCEHARSVDQALAIAQTPPVDEIFVAGGAEVYRQTITHADRLLITEVDTTVEGADAFFPAIDAARWRETSRTAERSQGGLGYAIVEYLRR